MATQGVPARSEEKAIVQDVIADLSAQHTGDAEKQICAALDTLAAEINSDAAITRTILLLRIESLQAAVKAATGRLGLKLSEVLVDHFVEYGDKRVTDADNERESMASLAQEEREIFDTAMRILLDDAGISERDLKHASWSVDPIGLLERARRGKSR